jgi:hypothetical protein
LAPCVGPTLGVASLLAAQRQNLVQASLVIHLWDRHGFALSRHRRPLLRGRARRRSEPVLQPDLVLTVSLPPGPKKSPSTKFLTVPYSAGAGAGGGATRCAASICRCFASTSSIFDISAFIWVFRSDMRPHRRLPTPRPGIMRSMHAESNATSIAKPLAPPSASSASYALR